MPHRERTRKQQKLIQRFPFLLGAWLFLTTEVLGNAILALIISGGVVVAWSLIWGFYWESGWISNITVEAHGMLLDILVIGVFVTLLNKSSQRKQEIKRYLEEIEDFKDWTTDSVW